jgi:DNA (cytosine-5)-methyltransferase 1
MVGAGFDTVGRVWGNEGVFFGEHTMCEWSVLDAQWFGVAQRRRRLFVVLDCGDWESRRPILLESDSLRGNSAPSREAQQGLTSAIETSSGETIKPVVFNMQAMGEYGVEDVASTLKARDYKDATDLIVLPTYAIIGTTIGRKPSNGGNGTGYSEELMYTLIATDHHAIVSDVVRKLTPVEAERLQGFPDGYTDVNGAVYSKRINALGRSMAVPVIKWIGQQIESCNY